MLIFKLLDQRNTLSLVMLDLADMVRVEEGFVESFYLVLSYFLQLAGLLELGYTLLVVKYKQARIWVCFGHFA